MPWPLRVLFATSVVASGCTPHVRRDPQTPISVPQAWSGPTKGQAVIEPFWQRFDDPRLNTLMTDLLGRNLDLAIAWTRIGQARARATLSGSGRWPRLDARLGVSKSKQLILFLPRGGSVEQTTYQASISASYELDVWGRIESLADAADMDVIASQEDLQAIAIGLAAALAEAWYSLAEQHAQLALLDEQKQINQTLLELVQLRFEHGVTSGSAVFQQQNQLQRIDARRPLIEARIATLEHQIGFLLAHAPGQLELSGGRLPTLPALPAIGVPSEVLDQRPDVRAAKARLIAADHRVGAAIAERLPALRLTGSVGLQSLEISKIFDDWIWNIAANLIAPLFDGGQRRAAVDVQRAALEGAVANLAKVTLTAIREVEDALVLERQQRAYIERLRTQLKTERALLDDAKSRYLEGVTDYLPVLTALRSTQQTAQGLLTARRQALSYRIQLHRALGGDWTQELHPVAIQ